jgi:hypothetical protein
VVRILGADLVLGEMCIAQARRGFEPRQELTALSARWQQLSAAQKDLQASAFLLVLDDGRYAALNPDRPQPAASSIKTPILLAGLEDVDSGKLAWNKSLPLTKEVVGGGAGRLKGNRHFVAAERTPIANLHLTLLDRAGIPLDKLGDSTGKFTEI